MDRQFAIEMSNISFSYGQKRVLQDFELKIEPGKVYCLIGSSGSGKTTSLRLMNGLLRPQKGSIKLFGDEFNFSEAEKWRRKMGYSIQGSGLFPHMTLEENLSIIARKESWSKEKIQNRIKELCELMSLPSTKEFLSKRPRQISGGQQQRVGIARALFMKPKIMLMDEPFSALDPITRSELQKEFAKLIQKLQLTIILVTHDLSEAFSMGDEIVLLNQGKIEQKGKPSKFLLSPSTPYVKEFIESHSPGNILKEVYLYSVVNSDLFLSSKDGNNIKVWHLETNQEQQFTDQTQAQRFLNEKGQSAHYWVDKEKRFLAVEEFDGLEIKTTLHSTSHILDGMKLLLDSKFSVVPVVNDNQQLVGVFSQEALDAL